MKNLIFQTEPCLPMHVCMVHEGNVILESMKMAHTNIINDGKRVSSSHDGVNGNVHHAIIGWWAGFFDVQVSCQPD